MGPEFFGVQWTGYLKPTASGVYTISAVTTDQVKVSMNSSVLIDCRTTCSDATTSLVAGLMYPLMIEYRSFVGNSSLSLRWSSGSTVPYAVIPSSNLFSSVIAGSLSTLTLRVVPNVVDNSKTLVWGAGLTIATAGVASTFSVRSFDTYGNIAWTVMNLNALLQPIGTTTQRGRYQSQLNALGPNAVTYTGNLPIAATYYQTSGMYATYYNAALRSVSTFPTQIAATYYSWAVSITLPTKGTYETTIVPWLSNSGVYATYYNNPDFSSVASSFTQASIDFSMPAVRFAPPTRASALANYGFGTGVNVSDPNSFSVRWRGFVQATATGVLTLSVTLKSASDRAKLWVDGVLMMNFADFPYTALNAAATVAVGATGYSGLVMGGVNSLFEVMLEYQKMPGSTANSGVTMTYNTLLTGYHYCENHAALPNMIVNPSAACSAASSLSGTGLTRATAGTVSSFDVQVRDAYGSATALPAFSNPLSLGSDFVVARLVPKVCEVTGRCSYVLGNVTVVDEALGTFRASYMPLYKGAYDVITSIGIMGKLCATYYTSASFAGSRSNILKPYSAAAVTVAAGTSSVRFQGFIRPPQAGVYTVYVTSASAATVTMRLVDPVTNVAVTGTSSGNAAATVNAGTARLLYDIGIDINSAQSATLMWKYGSMAAAAVIPSTQFFSRMDIKNTASIGTQWGAAGAVVLAAETCGSSTLVSGSGLSLATAGIAAKFSITAIDAYGNDRAVAEDDWIVRLSSSGSGNFSAGVWADTRVMQPTVYADNTYSTRTGPGRYMSTYTPTQSGSYAITVQRLTGPGLKMRIYCNAYKHAEPCQEDYAAVPLLSNNVLATEESQQASLAGFGMSAVWTGFLLVKTTETLTFTAAVNGTVLLRVDDKVCADANVCFTFSASKHHRSSWIALRQPPTPH